MASINNVIFIKRKQRSETSEAISSDKQGWSSESKEKELLGVGGQGGSVSLPRPINTETRRFSLKIGLYKRPETQPQDKAENSKILMKEYTLIINFLFIKHYNVLEVNLSNSDH